MTLRAYASWPLDALTRHPCWKGPLQKLDHSRKFPYPLRLRSSFDSFYKIICHQESRWRSDIDWGRVVSIMWDPQVVNPHNGHMSRS
jgi:hypothetical protein